MKQDFDRALALHRSGQLDKAKIIYLDLLKKDQNNPSLLQLLGTIYLQNKDYELSEKYFLQSLNNDPKNPGTLNNLGILKKHTNNLEKSIEYFEINIKKNNFLNSWVNKSNILLETDRNTEGLDFSREALEKHPNDRKLRGNYAIFLFKCGFQKESLKIYEKLDLEELHSPDSYFNYSNLLIQINNLPKSLDIINKLLLLDPKNLNGLRQRHYVNKLLLDFKKSEEDLLKAIKIDKFNFLSNKMIVELYIDFKKHEMALPYCNLMIQAGVEKDFFLSKKILAKIYTGDWKDLKNEIEIFDKNLNPENLSINPLSLKYLNDDALFQKEFTENYWNLRPKNNYLSKISSIKENEKNHARIKIGYFSGDFTNHAVFHLIQDLFVNHDKSRFEIFAYSTLFKQDSYRDKIVSNVDKFFDIDKLSDEEIIKLVKSHNLDFAIDLSGHTVHNKSHLFEYNISKIKINYLGYPGTMGTKKYDYIIADKNIIPETHFKFYSESIIHMPETYQPFTPKPFDIKHNRSDYGLPDNGFILGCFSRIEKILPNIFDVWMNILNKYSDVYLALCISNENIINNIKNYCKENDFDFTRIIFLKSINHEENLIRISNFDLYLDTYPYNGHTGISDSLFQSCVPTISLTGNSFASRVSYSLLNSLKLQKLVTFNEKDYSEKILYYYSNREELKKIKKYLMEYKQNNLNRMSKFTSDFEELLNSIYLKTKKLQQDEAK